MKTYKCPACGTKAQTETPRQGVTCPSCGIGWMPVHTETRAIGMPDQVPPQWRFYLYGAVAVLFLSGFLAWALGPIFAGLVVLVVIAVLLAMIVVRMKPSK